MQFKKAINARFVATRVPSRFESPLLIVSAEKSDVLHLGDSFTCILDDAINAFRVGRHPDLRSAFQDFSIDICLLSFAQKGPNQGSKCKRQCRSQNQNSTSNKS